MKNRSTFSLFRGTGRQKAMLAFCLAFCVSVPKLWAHESKGTLIEFDAPDAGTVNSPECAPNCGTIPYDNSDLGVIVGYYTDANIVPHGFLRTPDGHVTSFDAPGAGLGYGVNPDGVTTQTAELGDPAEQAASAERAKLGINDQIAVQRDARWHAPDGHWETITWMGVHSDANGNPYWEVAVGNECGGLEASPEFKAMVRNMMAQYTDAPIVFIVGDYPLWANGSRYTPPAWCNEQKGAQP